MTLIQKDGRTTRTVLVEAPNREVRDTIMNFGMEAGMQDALDLLEQLTVSLVEQRRGESPQAKLKHAKIIELLNVDLEG
jgi:hypothetical protein